MIDLRLSHEVVADTERFVLRCNAAILLKLALLIDKGSDGMRCRYTGDSRQNSFAGKPQDQPPAVWGPRDGRAELSGMVVRPVAGQALAPKWLGGNLLYKSHVTMSAQRLFL